MKNLCYALLLLLLFTVSISAQIRKQDVLNKEFFLKTPIPSSSDCKMLISPKGIHTKKDFCSFVYDEVPIFSDYKVKIVGFGKRKKWTKITYSVIGSDNNVTIYLQGSSKDTLAKSFDITFSKIKYENYGKIDCYRGDSKLKLFQCWGFPSSISKDGNLETYHYGLEFNGIIHWDSASVDLKDGKIVTIGVTL